VGTIPSSALAFLTLYLQLLGMSDFHASICTALFLAGQARPCCSWQGFPGFWTHARAIFASGVLPVREHLRFSVGCNDAVQSGHTPVRQPVDDA